MINCRVDACQEAQRCRRLRHECIGELVTWWLCNQCGREGRVTMKVGTGMYEGAYAVRESHWAVSPDCPEQFYIRVSIIGPIQEEVTHDRN